MATTDNSSPAAEKKGWGSQVLAIYEGFVLRDILGYVFPGAILVLGLIKLSGLERVEQLNVSLLSQQPSWVGTILGASVSYAAGVLIRVFGELIHLLVMSPQWGLLGDPWKTTQKERSGPPKWYEMNWRNGGADGSEQVMKTILETEAIAYDQHFRREAVFLHLSGNLGFAVVLLGLCMGVVGLFKGAMAARCGSLLSPCDALGCLKYFCCPLLLFCSGFILIAGHYRHASAIGLVLRLRAAQMKPAEIAPNEGMHPAAQNQGGG